MGDFIIIQAASDEVKEAVKINEKTLPEHYQMPFWSKLQSDFPKGFILAKKEGKVCGYVACSIHDEDFTVAGLRIGQVVSIAVLPDYRRLSIGSKLITSALNAMIDSQCNVAILQVREGNASAIALYQRYGFEVIEKEVKGYADGENALRMRKYLTTSNSDFAFL